MMKSIFSIASNPSQSISELAKEKYANKIIISIEVKKDLGVISNCSWVSNILAE